jgi:3-oxoacyl-[acyl-carrier protein] reductase
VKSAVVIGASSGIGRALAVALSADGYRIGAVARRTELLLQLQGDAGFGDSLEGAAPAR